MRTRQFYNPFNKHQPEWLRHAALCVVIACVTFVGWIVVENIIQHRKRENWLQDVATIAMTALDGNAQRYVPKPDGSVEVTRWVRQEWTVGSPVKGIEPPEELREGERP